MTDDFGKVWFATSAGGLEPGDLVLGCEDVILVGLQQHSLDATLAINLSQIAYFVGLDDLRAPEFQHALGELERIAHERRDQGRQGQWEDNLPSDR